MTVPVDEDMKMNTKPAAGRQQQHGRQVTMDINMQMPHQSVTVAGYTLQQKLGSGSFATVYKAVKYNANENEHADQSESDGSSTGAQVQAQNSNVETVAIKAIDFKSNKITKKVLENLDLEISILTTYRNPNIVCLDHAHKSDQYIYLILEYCAGGDLQGLIRSRKAGRLTEPLTRRLMRGLTSGLTFLASHNLIHRDIKPQNLLLTGPLPLDEMNDPGRTQEDEEIRRRADFPSAEFHLKIADFGFARHLKKTSLAETLCGSPLYMAPEILQHRSYDNKADLWSTGTVLFEMIAGRPPFHGENHMDLLRNIQQKAVRLPPDLKVSKECVKLLRILLNRNPLARAGFQDFIAASDAFVGLGCNGQAASGVSTTAGTMTGSISGAAAGGVSAMTGIKNLGPISEVEESHLHNSVAMESVHRGTDQHLERGNLQSNAPPMNRPGPSSNPPALIPFQSPQLSGESQQQHTHAYNNHSGSKLNSHFTPLEPSPPGPRQISTPEGLSPPPMSLKVGGNNNLANYRKSDSQHSHSDDSSSSGFVMVEKGSTSSISASTAASMREQERKASRSPLTMWKQSSGRRVVPASALSGNSSPPASPRTNTNRFFPGKALLSTRSMIPPSIPFVRKGMLSTSPGTGGALVGMMGSSNKIMANRSNDSFNFDSAAKMLSAADDVGRRAINVAHVGDTRAYLAMKLIISKDNASLQSSSGMESLVEETDAELAEQEKFTSLNRVRTVSADHSAMQKSADEEDDDEMPFAMPFDDDDEVQSSSSDVLAIKKSTSDAQNSRINSSTKPSPNISILNHFRQALSCYMKALSMLKSSVNASQQVLSEINRSIASSSPSSSTEAFLAFKKRCDVSHNWVSGQFKGVLERADAANSEISKIANQMGARYNEISPVTSVEELIYNHSLACGKDGAVKQLLGQYENARSCYRSAGLLAETLLMEPKLVDEDKKTLEEYVQGFSERINEIDCLMLHQSRHSLSSNGSFRGNASRRGSGASVVPLVSQNN